MFSLECKTHPQFLVERVSGSMFVVFASTNPYHLGGGKDTESLRVRKCNDLPKAGGRKGTKNTYWSSHHGAVETNLTRNHMRLWV